MTNAPPSEVWPMMLAGGICLAAMVLILVAILLDIEDWFEHWENK